jgi:hypothetical protein
MASIPGVSGERFDHKVAGIFSDPGAARQARTRLQHESGLEDLRADLLDAGSSHPGARLEPGGRGIWRTWVRAHLWLGLAGSVAGLLVFLGLWAMGIDFVVANAGWSAGLLVVFSAIGGLMLGGLVSLRPDQTPYLVKTREALEQGQTVLAVQAVSRTQMQSIESVLQAEGARTITTL